MATSPTGWTGCCVTIPGEEYSTVQYIRNCVSEK